ncbi:hypothetical protein BGZ60DRAFT_434257 [Tricladium varicosporioides]|nr:hypothetical protein BGZ60DRAFT_434257 [Hymenoscyphus varicosporioides]
MASTTSTRRVLGDLDVNTPTTSSLCAQPKGRSGSPTKPNRVGEAVYLRTSFEKEIQLQEQGQMGSSKRRCDLIADFREGGHVGKRTKSSSIMQDHDKYSERVSELEKSNADGIFAIGPLRTKDTSENTVDYQNHSSPSISPTPSSASSQEALDDTQQTLLTELDETPLLTTANYTITSRREAAREKARILRLRLRLANYKVQTNQINIPVEKLQLRSTLSTNFSRRVSTPVISTPSTPDHHFPLPTTPYSMIPSISLQEPSTKKIRSPIITVPSSPPASSEDDHAHPRSPSKDDEGSIGGSATPLFFGQIGDLPNPPLIGAEGGSLSKNLDSSVVKGRAADGLCLMRQIF